MITLGTAWIRCRGAGSALSKMTSKSKSAAFSDYLKAVGEADRKKKCEEEAAKLASEKQSEKSAWQDFVNNSKVFGQKLVNDGIAIKDGFAGVISGGANTILFWQTREQKAQNSEAIKQLFGVENGTAPHVHFGDNEAALNNDGIWHDAGKGLPTITNKIAGWLLENGWKLPKE